MLLNKHQVMKAYNGVEVELITFLTLGLIVFGRLHVSVVLPPGKATSIWTEQEADWTAKLVQNFLPLPPLGRTEVTQCKNLKTNISMKAYTIMQAHCSSDKHDANSVTCIE